MTSGNRIPWKRHRLSKSTRFLVALMKIITFIRTACPSLTCTPARGSSKPCLSSLPGRFFPMSGLRNARPARQKHERASDRGTLLPLRFLCWPEVADRATNLGSQRGFSPFLCAHVVKAAFVGVIPHCRSSGLRSLPIVRFLLVTYFQYVARERAGLHFPPFLFGIRVALPP